MSRPYETLGADAKRELLARRLRERRTAKPGHPLSFAQSRLWFLDQLVTDGTAYNTPVALRLVGELDAHDLWAALDGIVARHEVLRTHYEAPRGGRGEPRAVVDEPRPLERREVDLSAEAAPLAAARDLARELVAEPFDLARGPVLRARLARLGARDHALLLSVHHIAYDGWSNDVLVGELLERYAAARAGREPELPELALQVTELAERERRDVERSERDLRFWRETLAGAVRTDLPTDRSRPPRAHYAAAKAEAHVPAAVAERLDALAREERASLFQTVLGVLAAWLSRITAQEDVVLGTPVAGRDRKESEALIGCFVNSLVLRCDVSGDPTVRELVRRVRATCLDALEHGALPFERLVTELEPERDLSRNPFFDVLFSLQSSTGVEPPVSAGVRVEPLELDSGHTRFDLEVYAGRGPDGLRWLVNYRTDLFDRATIERWLDQWVRACEAVAEDPERTVSAIPLASASERERTAARLVGSELELPAPTLHELVLGRADSEPNAVAVSAGGEALTYGALDARSAALAARLRARGVEPGDLVGVELPRTVDLPVALLAVLRCGAAYLPLDAHHPEERRRFVVADAGPRLVLTEGDLRDLDELDGNRDPVPFAGGPDDLAYVLYTSGSTGTPKGVEVCHRGVVSFLASMAREPGLSRHDVVCAVTTLAFDISVLELFGPLSVGGRVELVDAIEAADGEALARRLDECGATVLQATPATWRLLLAAGWRGRPALTALVGGEAWDRGLAAELLPRVRALWNLYGPTETTVWSAASRVRADDAAIRIGPPIANTTFRVVEPSGLDAPVGVPGELVIGGAGVARGYRGRPALTAERFVTDERLGRAYRTGDRVRLGADGSLAFLGRLDDQLKLRGFRIEPGEIEARLVERDDVREARVVLRDDTLVAYVVAEGPLEPGALRAHLAVTCPDYMVPAHFVALDALPLNPSGKLDRAALPEPEAAGAEAYAPPRGALEELLCELFGDVLGLARVGRDDDFFARGGHSLLATQLAGRVRAACEVDLPLAEVFTAPSVASLARRIEALQGTSALDAIPTHAGDEAPLSFQQQRLWFLDRLDPGSPAYHVQAARRLTGELDADALERALADVVALHPALRTCFPAQDGTPVQRVAPQLDVALARDTVRDEELEARVHEEAIESFDLEHGPLVRASLWRLVEREHVFVLTLHHIVCDAWSLDRIWRDLSAAYAARSAGREPSLVAPGVRYLDYAAWQRRTLAGEALERELGHWREVLADAPTLDLPTDLPRPRVQALTGRSATASLGPETTRALRALARGEQATLFQTVLAALSVWLGRHAGQEDVVVGTPISGRDRLAVDDVVGLFVNTLVLRTDLSGNPSFRELIARVRRTALDAYAHQDVPFEKLVEELDPVRDPSRNPLFGVFVNWVDVAEEARIELSGLEVEPAGKAPELSKFDLTLYLFAHPDRVDLRVHYDAALFTAETIEVWLERLATLLEHASREPSTPVGALPLIAEPERRALQRARNLDPFSIPLAPFPEDVANVPARFRQVVGAHAERVAVDTGDERCTYAELASLADRVSAGVCARVGDTRGERVALLFEPGAWQAAAPLGVLAAGQASVPLDPRAPAAWSAEVLRAVRPAIVLTDRAHAERAAELAGDAPLLLVEELHEASAPQVAIEPNALAYVRFTSGSTGRPKGVAQSHRGLLGQIRSYVDSLHVTPDDRLTLLSPVTFDGGLVDLYTALLTGATLCPVAVRGRSPRELFEALRDRGVTIYHSTPSVFRYLCGGLGAGEVLDGVRLVVFGGEEARPSDLDSFHEHAPADALCVHGLGCTESSQILQAFYDGEDAGRRARLPVGRPIPGCEAILLDPRGEETDVRGELAVVGHHVARGYWDDEDGTAARFTVLPDGRRRYRTGDLVHRLADGRLEWLGRTDDQVQVRGHRVEPAQVDAVLRAHAAVHDAVVVARRAPEPRLDAYVVAPASSAAELMAHLRARLPDYLVPATLTLTDSIPRTSSGKPDRAALPEPDAAPALHAPATESEAILAAIVADLLELERVDVTASFFDLGGHSLLATRLASRVREALDVDLPLRWVFEDGSVRGLCARLAERRSTDEAPLVAGEAVGEVPLTFAQERLWFLERLQPGSGAFHLHVALELEGELAPARIERALGRIVARHASLRTSFHEAQDGTPFGRVEPNAHVALEVSSAPEDDLDARLADEAARAFDLVRAPLLRAHLFELAPARHVLALTLHHLVGDAWSMGVLLRELRCAMADEPCAELAVQYPDVARWQRGQLSGERLDAELERARARLAGAPARLALPTDRPYPAVEDSRGARTARAFERVDAGDLARLARAADATRFVVLLAGLQALLARASGQTDLVIGTPVAGRPTSETEDLIGLFVNTVPVRGDLAGDPSFRELLVRTRAATLDAFEQAELPFERLVAALAPERDLSHHPVYQVQLVLHNAPRAEVELPGLVVTTRQTERTSSALDLSLHVTERRGRIGVLAEYKTSLFDRSTVESLLEGWERLLEGAAADVERPLSRLALCDPRPPLAGPSEPGLEDATLYRLVDGQAARTPDAVAVTFGDAQLTYRELIAHVHALAARLHERGVKPGDRVATCVERGLGLVVAPLGVARAGAAFVPLDPSHPDARRAVVLEDADVALVLTDADLEGFEIGAAARPDTLGPGDLAYVLFTSGSTGRPKGVEVTHGNLANFLRAMRREPGLRADDVLVSVTTPAFDISLLELFGPLTVGGRVAIADAEQQRDGRRLAALLEREGATVLQATPATWQQLVESEWEGRPELRAWVGGEAWTRALADQLLPRVRELWNMYGPTETTVWSAATRVEADGTPIRIGAPIANTTFHVVDEHGASVPRGFPGELVIGGAGVALGYRGRPELTAERFVELGYRTGDLVREEPDGTLRFLGRADGQVKLRGFRIELGEIEAALAEHGEAAVALHGEQLVAYVTDPSLGADTLRASLAGTLPAYMVPSRFVYLDELPRTTSDKIDRKRLPAPDEVRSDAPFVPLRGAVEQRLGAIWTELLGAKQVGATDDFFALGGHSLLATRLLARVRDAFGVELPLLTVFESRTLRELARRLDAIERGARESIPRVDRSAPLPLSFGQERLWFLDRLQPESGAYHLHQAVILRGALDADRLWNALDALVQRHEVLRTRLVTDEEGVPHQVVDEPRALPRREERGDAEELAARDACAPFDLASDWPLRVCLVTRGPDEHALLLTVHHVAADAWSLGLLWKELAALYGGATLPELRIQYADVAAWQRGRLDGGRAEREVGFWRETLAGAPSRLELATDRSRPTRESFAGARARRTLDRSLLAGLRDFAARHDATLFQVLLAGYASLLRGASGAEDLVVGTPVSGRTHTATEDLIGLFANNLALRVDASGDPTFTELVERAKRTSLAAQGHAELPFERLVQALDVPRDLAHHPLYQVMLVLQNAPREGERIGDLELEPLTVERSTSALDQTWFAWETAAGLELLVEFKTELWDLATIETWLERFERLLGQALAAPDRPIEELHGFGEPRALPAPSATKRPAPAAATAADPAHLALVSEVWRELLEIDRVAPTDDFFALGGHSLMATRVQTRLRQRLGVELPLSELFEHPTLAGLAARIGSATVQAETAEIARAPRDAELPLSFAQGRMWFLEQVQPGTAAFHLRLAVRLRGVLDESRVANALTSLVRRHDALRSAFPTADEGQPRRVLLDPIVELPREDLTDLLPERREDRLHERLDEESRIPFDVAHGPLLRARLFALDDNESVLLVTVHHLVSDAWSLGIVWRELVALYRGDPLPELALHEPDFAAWQRERLAGERLERLADHWRSELAGAPALLALPTDRPRPAVETFAGARCEAELDSDLVRELDRFATEHHATLFQVLLAGLQGLLARLTGQDDVVVGTPVAGRPSPDLEAAVGLFVNTVPVRARLDDDPGLGDLADRVRTAAVRAVDHAELPFEELVRAIRPPRTLAHHPVYQVMLAWQDAPRATTSLEDLEVAPIATDRAASQLDLTLFAWRAGDRVRLSAEFKRDLFDVETIERRLELLARLLRSGLQQPDVPISVLPLVTVEERVAQLELGRGPQLPVGQATLLTLVEEQVSSSPESVCVQADGEPLTYRAMWERSESIARALVAAGVAPGDVVATALPRGADLVCAPLGICRAGAAFLPLDPSHPPERTQFVLADAAARLVLTDTERDFDTGRGDVRTLALDSIVPTTNGTALPTVTTEHLAYLIYTSGSTGRPKGVEIEHRSLANFLRSMAREPGIEPSDVWCAVTTPSFDISILELFGPLTRGARVVIVPSEVVTDGVRLESFLRSVRATVLQATPATWRLLLEARWPGDRRLKALVGGEAWTRHLADQLLPRVAELWNVYGPTETTIWSAASKVGPGTQPVRIAGPVANTTLRVLDPAGGLVPIGMPGELAIGGAGVARGYRDRPELTADRFVASSFPGERRQRLYRTGDLVQRHPDGSLQFLGRLDAQVKVAGFRIELGEIEAVLAEHQAVRDVAVSVRGSRPEDQRLAAYVVLEDGASIDVAELTDFSAQRLPAYMVPRRVVPLERLPTTTSGKVDRNALPEPPRMASADSGSEPRAQTETERAVGEIWCELLELEAVSPRDTFFDLGGHSLLAMRAVARIEKRLGVTIAPGELILQSLAQVAARCDAARELETSRSAGELHAVSDSTQRVGLIGRVRGLWKRGSDR